MGVLCNANKTDRLNEEPFAYQTTKKGSVLISYEGKQIKIVNGKEAEKLIARLEKAGDQAREVQLLLAKVTGNFKRGNEKAGKNKFK
ncbi:hypothetical protein VBD025_14435 [Virgibacillus flavescens]|uniref:hypothetical protein n=1 Tax=Virgibacillus flavescens TaxID=1611422 RepID=UPI003D3560EE